MSSNQRLMTTKRNVQRRLSPAPCSAAILDYPNESGWWWAWAANAKRWYLISISPDDLNNDPELDNVPTGYAWWTKCVPPLPPNVVREPSRTHDTQQPET